MHEFEGKTAVITGGASGIGLALAKRFGDARMQVVLADMGANIGASVLCPGFVSTAILDADRNRPEELAGSELAAGDEARAVGKALLAKGKQPEEIADIVFEAIRNSEFYILPHPSWDDTVRRRVECVIDRKAPMEFDMAELLKRQEAGEAL